MLNRETNDIEQLKKEAAGADVVAIKTVGTDLSFIRDKESVLIVAEDGHLVIPIEEIPAFIENMKTAGADAVRSSKNLNMSAKLEIAKNKGMSYGRFQGKLALACEYFNI